MPVKFTAAYADIVQNKFSFMSPNGEIKESRIVPSFLEHFCTVNNVVTLGEWAANMGLLTVKTLIHKQTFASMGFPNATLEDKVRFIHELSKGMYGRSSQ